VRRLLNDLDAWYAETGADRSIVTETGELVPMPSGSVDR
jgi:hypothetical protein